MIGQCNSNLSIKNIPHLFNYAVSMEFKDKEASKNLLDLYRETIDELNPEVQNIVRYQLKLSTERRFEDKMNYLSKDYEKHRFMFRADHESIVLEGNCEKCKQRTTKVISYFDYRDKTTLIDRNDPIRLDCEICKTKDSYVIPNF
jgi:activator of HSP90 ATPase